MKTSANAVLATEESLASLCERCKGKSGGNEAETVLCYEAWNPDYVEITTSRLADVPAIVHRCGSAVLCYWEHSESVTLRISRKVNGKRIFRGFEYAFAPVDVVSSPWPGGAS